VGSIVATVLWLAGSLLFSIYIDNFGKVGKTYGSFAAVVTLMLWLFLTAYVILIGAEINAESESQTAEDSTEAPDEPMGQRGAYHADHVAGGEEVGRP
jgi:membrane protein